MVGSIEVICIIKIVTHLIAENHEQHNYIRVVEIAEVVSRVATKRIKDGFHGFRTLSYKAFQFAFPAETVNWQNIFLKAVKSPSEAAYMQSAIKTSILLLEATALMLAPTTSTR